MKNKLYGETFDNPAKRLGNLDANLLIEKYLKNEFKRPCILEDEFSHLLIKLIEENKIVPPDIEITFLE